MSSRRDPRIDAYIRKAKPWLPTLQEQITKNVDRIRDVYVPVAINVPDIICTLTWKLSAHNCIVNKLASIKKSISVPNN